MASNSRREQLLVLLTNKLGELSEIKTVQRVRPVFADLDSIASTQLPMIAVVGRLPSPVQKKQGRKQNDPEIFISKLGIDLYFYGLANEDPDTWVSYYADDIWSKLYEAPTFGKKWVLELTVTPEVEVGIFDPYIVFRIICTLTYLHTVGGI